MPDERALTPSMSSTCAVYSAVSANRRAPCAMHALLSLLPAGCTLSRAGFGRIIPTFVLQPTEEKRNHSKQNQRPYTEHLDKPIMYRVDRLLLQFHSQAPFDFVE